VEPTIPTKAELGAAIRRLRTEANLSIEALADAAEMHPTYLSGIERGINNPSWTKLTGLATGLGVAVSAIVDAAEAEAATRDETASTAPR
jgi:transcriptional regulator with XRE-family HTH domain